MALLTEKRTTIISQEFEAKPDSATEGATMPGMTSPAASMMVTT